MSYACASTDDSAYIIGGNISKFYQADIAKLTNIRTDTIAQFKDNVWNNIGNLKSARSGHSAITIGSLTMIVGGISKDDILPYAVRLCKVCLFFIQG